MTRAALLVVRPRAQATDWVARLAAEGVDAHALPLIGILPAPDPAAVLRAFGRIAASAARAPVLVFVSANAVEGFFEAAGAPAWPAGALAGATGPGTVAALRAAGVPEAAIAAPPVAAAQFDSEALWAVIGAWPWAGRPAWLVRGNGGREWLGDQLRAAGAEVQVLQSYARAAPVLDAAERALLAAARAAPARWAWLFSASEAIDNLEALAPGADWSGARALATHPRIAERARAAGFGEVALVAATPVAVAAALHG